MYGRPDVPEWVLGYFEARVDQAFIFAVCLVDVKIVRREWSQWCETLAVERRALPSLPPLIPTPFGKRLRLQVPHRTDLQALMEQLVRPCTANGRDRRPPGNGLPCGKTASLPAGISSITFLASVDGSSRCPDGSDWNIKSCAIESVNIRRTCGTSECYRNIPRVFGVASVAAPHLRRIFTRIELPFSG